MSSPRWRATSGLIGSRRGSGIAGLMSDVVGYILILGLLVFPAYAAIQLGERIMYAVFENQSLLLSFPFP